MVSKSSITQILFFALIACACTQAIVLPKCNMNLAATRARNNVALESTAGSVFPVPTQLWSQLYTYMTEYPGGAWTVLFTSQDYQYNYYSVSDCAWHAVHFTPTLVNGTTLGWLIEDVLTEAPPASIVLVAGDSGVNPHPSFTSFWSPASPPSLANSAILSAELIQTVVGPHVSVLSFNDISTLSQIGFQQFTIKIANQLRYYSTYIFDVLPLDVKITSSAADFPTFIDYCWDKFQAGQVPLMCDPAGLPSYCQNVRICIPPVARFARSEPTFDVQNFVSNWDLFKKYHRSPMTY